MNGYKVFFKGQVKEVYASTSYEAQQKGAALFKARKAYDVSVILCERDGVTVEHSGAEF